LILTSKRAKEQVKRETENILKGLTLPLITPGLTQPGTLYKAQRNPRLCTYLASLQREAENGPALDNVIIPNSNKRNYIVLFGAPDPKDFLKLEGNKKQAKKITSNDNQSKLSNKTVTTCKEKLQSSLAATEEKLLHQIEEKCKTIELNFNEILPSTLKDFQNTILSEVVKMVSNQIELQITKQM